MSLFAPDAALALAVCPSCRDPLDRAGRGLSCSSPTCVCGAQGSFPIAGGQTVLVNFERSILSLEQIQRTAGASVVPRSGGHGLRRLAHRIFTPYNRSAARNAALLGRWLGRRASRPRLLIVGGGTIGNGAESLYEDAAFDVIAFDLYASQWTQFIADAHQIPLPNRSVDAVWIQAVLEHVLDPGVVVSEVHRVLADDGLVYAETPFLQGVHEGPVDFTRFTESGHRWLFRCFEALESGVVAGPGLALAWSIDYTIRGIFRSKLVGTLMRLPFFWVPWLDRVMPARFAVDGASCVFFLGRKSPRELAPREMLKHYKGAQSTRP